MELDPEIIQTIGELNPDVILLGIDTIKTETIELITNIRKENPTTKILFITTDTDEDRIYKALKAGAGGYVLKDASTSELIKAIYAVQEGGLRKRAPARGLSSGGAEIRVGTTTGHPVRSC